MDDKDKKAKRFVFGGRTEDEMGKKAKAFFDAERNKKASNPKILGGRTENDLAGISPSDAKSRKNKLQAMIAESKAKQNVEDGRRKPNPFIDLNDPKGMQEKFGKVSRPRKGSKR